MTQSFLPAKLIDAKLANWAEPCLMTLTTLKKQLTAQASAKYKELYMSESSGVVNVISDMNIFNSIFKQHSSSQDRYSSLVVEHDPYRMLKPVHTNSECLLSFNKKFALDINLVALLQYFSRGKGSSQNDYSRIYFADVPSVMSFLTTNFLLSDKLEKKFESILSTNSDNYTNGADNSVPNWHFDCIDEFKEGQLLKTCMTLSPEGVAIFNSVANLTTPTDILSWLELSKDHFINKLPFLLSKKYGKTIASPERIQAIISAGIEFYSTILSAAEPFSTKMLNTDETGD
jgi:hypothetical protein